MQFPQSVALEHTQLRVGEGLHAVGCGIAHFLLHADEVARQQKRQDLPPTIAQGFVAKGPAAAQGEQRGIGLPFKDQGFACAQLDFAALEGLHQRQLVTALFDKQGQWPQGAGAAPDFIHGFSFGDCGGWREKQAMSFDTLSRCQHPYIAGLRLSHAFMHASYPPNPLPDEALRAALEDWELLFAAVLTRLRDTVVRDATGQPLCPVVLECADALEQLRRAHPVYVR